MKNLQLSLKKQWFEMTKAGIKCEDYREITPYWIRRLIDKNFAWSCIYNTDNIRYHLDACPSGFFKKFTENVMTLGYPKSTDTERILRLEHKGIEIRTGKTEWGAEPGRLYFVIMHGNPITEM